MLCAVMADAKAFGRASKAWIPQSAWWAPSRIDSFIIGAGLQPAKTLRFSSIDGASAEGALQMVIPKRLLYGVNKGGLGISVVCAEAAEDMGSAPVAYEAWDIRGEPQGSLARGRAGAAGAAEGGAESAPGGAEAASASADGFGDGDLVGALERGEVPEGRFLAEGIGAAAREGMSLEAAAFMQETRAARQVMAVEAAMAEAEAAAGDVVVESAFARLLGLVAEDVIEVRSYASACHAARRDEHGICHGGRREG